MNCVLTDRPEEKIELIRSYLKITRQFRDYNDESQDPHFTKVWYTGKCLYKR